MHVLKIHNVKLDFTALALAMGNGKLPILSLSVAIPSHMKTATLSTFCFLFCVSPISPALVPYLSFIFALAITIPL